MKYYFCSRYSRKEELLQYKTEIEDLGHEVTSRWLTAPPPRSTEDSDPDFQQYVATMDEEDILLADIVIAFTEVPRKVLTRGGRHVEFGIARGAGKQLILIGPVENDFYQLDGVQHYLSWNTYLKTVQNNKPESSERVQELEEVIKYLAAALYDATHDNIDLYNSDNNLELVISGTDVDTFIKEFQFSFDYDEVGDGHLTYKDKVSKVKKIIKPKVTKRIY